MSSDQDAKAPASEDAEVSTEQNTAVEQGESLETVQPNLTGMIGMHIEQPQEDATTGSPGADTDRDLAEK